MILLLERVLKKNGVLSRYIENAMDMYNGVVTGVRTLGGETNDFPITIGL